MKRNIIALTAFFLLFAFSEYASAQKLSKKISIGFGLEAGMPSGDLKYGYSFGAGLTLRGAYHLGPGFITLTTGGLLWIPKNIGDEDMNLGIQIPVKAGYKFIFKNHFFAMGEIGYNSFKSYGLDINGNISSFNNNGLVFAPALGVQFNAIELGLRYELFPMNFGTGSMLGIRLGFNF